jgi:hypothetical protein
LLEAFSLPPRPVLSQPAFPLRGLLFGLGQCLLPLGHFEFLTQLLGLAFRGCDPLCLSPALLSELLHCRLLFHRWRGGRWCGCAPCLLLAAMGLRLLQQRFWNFENDIVIHTGNDAFTILIFSRTISITIEKRTFLSCT